MKLTRQHKDFCAEYLESTNATESYHRVFKPKSRNTSKSNSCKLVQKPEIKAYIEKLQKDKHDVTERAKELAADNLKDKIISETELDYFHTQVMRGEIMVEEVYPVREYIPIQRNDKNEILAGTGKWIISFKKITRAPNIRERQLSASELYRRKGSYSPTKFKAEIEDAQGKEDATDKTNFIILSDGSKIPLDDDD